MIPLLIIYILDQHKQNSIWYVNTMYNFHRHYILWNILQQGWLIFSLKWMHFKNSSQMFVFK